MKHLSVIPCVLLVASAAPGLALAQTPADNPHGAAVPTVPATTPETPPPGDVQARQTPQQTPAPAPPPAVAPEVRPDVPPPDPRWSMTPAPIWWGNGLQAPQVPARRWYGWQTLIVVSAADVVTLASGLGLSGDAAAFGLFLGASGHVFSGPIVHWTHGRVGRGFGVLGLNLTFTAVGALSTPLFPSSAYLIPAILGYLAGPTLDIAVFSTEVDKAPMSNTASRTPGVTFGVIPMVDSTRRGILLTGQF
ncbi:MAG TPA: hypothetical protein PK156_06130 [Polyangium sp.]|nr:hypothetical protein [Polyangium sp.]